MDYNKENSTVRDDCDAPAKRSSVRKANPRYPKAQKVTPKELAAPCGTGIRFIRELEKGKASCELGKALLVTAILGIKLEAQPPLRLEAASLSQEKGQ